MLVTYGPHRFGIVGRGRSRLSTHRRTIPAPEAHAHLEQVALNPVAKRAGQLGDGLVEAFSRLTVYLKYVHAFKRNDTR
jgi:hypothetical protein